MMLYLWHDLPENPLWRARNLQKNNHAGKNKKPVTKNILSGLFFVIP